MCHAVFATDTLGFSPEWFSRGGGELYLAGLNTTQIPLPEVATDAKIDPNAIKQLKDCAFAMMGTVDGKEMEITREALVCCAIFPAQHILRSVLTNGPVFSPSDIQRTANRLANPGRETRCRLQDARGWPRRCLCYSWPRCMGNCSVCRHRPLHERAGRGQGDISEHQITSFTIST